jgi:hypothetical protein
MTISRLRRIRLGLRMRSPAFYSLTRIDPIGLFTLDLDDLGAHLETSPWHFAHVLLFACPQCGRPLASACYHTERNLETADAHLFNPHCHCGWTGDVRGLTAVKHWVEPWPSALPTDAAGSCEATDTA